MNMSLPSIRPIGLAPLICLFSLLVTVSFSVSAQTGSTGSGAGVELNPKHPDSYVVKRGDTLWDISAMFLRDPWYWPEIWQVNPQVDNPHLIFPGDILTLVYVDGQPRIQLQRTTETGREPPEPREQRAEQRGGEERLSPRIRVEDLDEAITTIPFESIGAFLSKGSILPADEMERLPYIAAIREGHLIAGAGNDVYVRGDIDRVNQGYSVVHIGDPLIDPDDKQIVGYRANFVGEGVIRQVGDPSTLRLVKTQREALEGDRLVSQDFDIPLRFFPKPPARQVDGRIIDVLDGMTVIGQFQVVVLNRGVKHGLEAGSVLTVWQAGQIVTDRFAGAKKTEKILLPDEEAGTLMVFKSYERISYALIMEATTEIHILDKVRNPI